MNLLFTVLSNLKTASESIGELQKAFKELSDDGYTHKKILRAFINLNEQNSSFQKYKDIISLYPIEKNNLFNTIFFDFLGKIKCPVI